MTADPQLIEKAIGLIIVLTRNTQPVVNEGIRLGLPMSKIVSGMQEVVDAGLKDADLLGLPKPLVQVFLENHEEGIASKFGELGMATFAIHADADPDHWSYDALGGKEFKLR